MDLGFPIAFIAIAMVLTRFSDSSLVPNNAAVRSSYKEQRTQQFRQLGPKKWYHKIFKRPGPNPDSHFPISAVDVIKPRPDKIKSLRIQQSMANVKAKLDAVQALNKKRAKEDAIKETAADAVQSCKKYSAVGFAGAIGGIVVESALGAVIGVAIEKAWDKLAEKPSCTVQEKFKFKIVEKVQDNVNSTTECKQKCIDVINRNEALGCKGFTFKVMKETKICKLMMETVDIKKKFASGFCKKG